MTSTPTLNLRWRKATVEEVDSEKYVCGVIEKESLMATFNSHYVLEQQFRIQFADEQPELEWRVVEIAK